MPSVISLMTWAINALFATVGGSMGGMQALQWAVAYPERVRSVVFLASAARSSALHIAFNETGGRLSMPIQTGTAAITTTDLLRRQGCRSRA